jgi:Flp pilus assembly protein TadB
MPTHLSIYEKGCQLSGKLLKIKPDSKKVPALEESIRICHLDATPSGTASFALLFPIVFALVGSLLGFALFQSLFFVFFFLIAGAAMMKPLADIPHYFAQSWRMKASNQMVLSVFYVVTYMRHTSNLELAIDFAAQHISPPLSLDLRKVLWDVETEVYPNIKEALDDYLETWRKWNPEFIESFHLIESSLYEGSEEKRLSTLDKSLTVILDGTYEKMLHYAHNLNSPITMLNMLGVVLPILGLVILPLVVSFMSEIQWFHIATLYNIVLPVAVYFIGSRILASRPTGYGSSDISEYNSDLKKKRNVIFKVLGQDFTVNPLWFCVILGLVFFVIGYLPLVLHVINPSPDFDYCWFEGGFVNALELEPRERGLCFLDYREGKLGTPQEGETIGPYGLGASLFSISAVLGLGLAIGLFFKFRSKNVIKIRDQNKKLEAEFASALFTLGNRLGDGLPPEVAFSRVAQGMETTVSGRFFNITANNIQRLGMGVEEAIFNPKYGSLKQFPSSVVESSMKVLVESAKKGGAVAANSLMNVSNYIKQIHKVDERLKDLLAETISSMKSQIGFLAPVISGIVIGITSMVTFILGQLSKKLTGLTAGEAAGGVGGMGLLSFFGDGVPTFYFQIIVGIYVIELVFILSVLVNGIENGNDKLNERFLIGNNATRSTLLYCFIAGAVILVFNLLANVILSRAVG